MPIEQKRFAGIMNLDDKPEFILANQHINALNIRFYGGAQGLTAQNIPGNTLVTNNDLPAGINNCIGSFYDGLKQRIFWFNWNNNGRNGIYQYTLSDNTITPVLISFTDSQTDILNFQLNYPIPSVNIIYTTEEDGDILTWTDRLNRPRELNIKDALDNLFGTDWLSEYLDVAKQPPEIPIACAYEDDATSIVNNLKNKLYRFKYRFIYGTFQKSTWSSISKMPVPFNYTSQAVDTDPTKNCRIGLIFETGGQDVVSIEIAAQENLGVTWGNFFSVQILDKSELSIPSDDTYIWAFYNNEAYDYVDLQESLLDFDRVPDLANTQELLNGNVIVYGGITEGHNPVVPDVDIAIQDDDISEVGYPVQGMVTQKTGLGNIRISLVGKPAYASSAGQSSDIDIVIKAGASTYNINAAAISASTTISDMITQISSIASGFGFTIVSTTSNSIVLTISNNILYTSIVYGNGNNLKSANESVPANEFSSKENWGIEYIDAKGKNNGVTTDESFVANITPLVLTPDAQIFELTAVQMTINSRPPDWAVAWKPVRTNNLTKSNFLSWISDRTFKNDTFAYISIESINTYKVQYPTSIISYDFLVGDRIKFVALFNNDKTVAQNYSNTHDYEIVGIEVNPIIDGLPQGGTFLKINLPTTSVAFDFGNFLSNAYYFYYIELYTPAKSVANNLNVYYEIGEYFPVGNPGTSLAYHQGNIQNQTSDLVTPAICLFRGGDSWYRLREVRAGAFFTANIVPEVTYIWQNEPVLVLSVPTIPTGTSYTVKNTVAGNTSNPNNWLIKTGLVAVTFNIKGDPKFRALSTTTNTLFLILQTKNPGGGGGLITVISQLTGGVSNGQIFQMDINVTLTIPANRTVVIYLQESPVGSTPFSANSVSGDITFIDTEHDFTVGVIDPNFSDFYESKVNSNGRALVVNPDEKEIKYDTLLRWGLSYQQDTNINQINRFFPNNFNEVDRSRGAIQRFVTMNRALILFQERAVGHFGVFTKFIQSNSDTDQLTTTNEILTKDNVEYYKGEYGVGTQYCSIVVSKQAIYFVDPVRGYQVRLSQDGLIPISELYKGQFYIRDLLTPYNKTYTHTVAGIDAYTQNSKVLGIYNYFDEEYVCLLQGGIRGSETIDNYAFSFNEKRNGYSSFFSYNTAEWLEAAEDVIYSWKNGGLWKHDNTTTYSSFYGVQYDCSITLVFNLNYLEKKTWESITELASAIWAMPLAYGDVYSYAGQLQETMLGEYDFATLEGQFQAAILRDSNSIGGILNGDIVKGSYLVVKLVKQNASDLIWLSEVSIMFKDSPLTNK